MEQSFSKIEKQPSFIFPDIESEYGEIERTAKAFSKSDDFITEFNEKAKNSKLIDLTENIWEELENTDSFDIEKGDWNKVEYHASHVNRDWKILKNKIEEGQSMDAPIILMMGERYHLVSGNTRLMVARANGTVPQVLIVEMDNI